MVRKRWAGCREEERYRLFIRWFVFIACRSWSHAIADGKIKVLKKQRKSKGTDWEGKMILISFQTPSKFPWAHTYPTLKPTCLAWKKPYNTHWTRKIVFKLLFLDVVVYWIGIANHDCTFLATSIFWWVATTDWWPVEDWSDVWPCEMCGFAHVVPLYFAIIEICYR